MAKPLSGLDVTALLQSVPASTPSASFTASVPTTASPTSPSSTPTISLSNSIPDFKRTLAVSTSLATIHAAAASLGAHIRTLVTTSFADTLYPRAIENLAALRSELVQLEEAAVYNAFICDFKARLLAGEFGGDRRDFWRVLKRARFGVIGVDELEEGGISPDEVDAFYKTR